MPPGDGQEETFILIPGRTSRQGTSLNEGKFTAAYVEETSTLLMCPADMKRLGLHNGARVRLRSEQGQVELPCQAAKDGDLPQLRNVSVKVVIFHIAQSDAFGGSQLAQLF